MIRALASVLVAATLVVASACSSSSSDDADETSTTTSLAPGVPIGEGEFEGYDAEAICASLTVAADVILQAQEMGDDLVGLRAHLLDTRETVESSILAAIEISPPGFGDALSEMLEASRARNDALEGATTPEEIGAVLFSDIARIDEVGPYIDETLSIECGFELGI